MKFHCRKARIELMSLGIQDYVRIFKMASHHADNCFSLCFYLMSSL